MIVTINTDNKTVKLQNEVSIEELSKFILDYKLQDYKIDIIKGYIVQPYTYPIIPYNPYNPYQPFEVMCSVKQSLFHFNLQTKLHINVNGIFFDNGNL